MNTICIIGVYFGKFNDYFPLWLKSCANNPKIDFRIYTDASFDGVIPSNVHFVDMTMTKLRDLASNKLGVEINLQRYYKCCDLRPMYGLIFEDDLALYKYWGECDFDLIWGDLQSYLELYDLTTYDKFSPLGHFSLYRNVKEVNRSFMLDGDKCGGWRHVVQTNESFAFDEIPGICEIFINNGLKFFRKKLFADISPMYYRYKLSEYCFLDNDQQKNYDYQIFYWENGKIFRAYIEKNGSLAKEELMYIHFRSRPNYTISDELKNCSSFYITNTGFYVKDTEVSIEKIQQYNKFKSVWSEKIEFILYKLKFLKKRIVRKFQNV